MQRYINDALACEKSVEWVVKPDEINDIVKAVGTKFTHKVSMDWDDISILWLILTRK